MANFSNGDFINKLNGNGPKEILHTGTTDYFIKNLDTESEFLIDITTVDADYILSPKFEGSDIIAGFYFTDNNNKLNLVLAVVGTRAIIFYLNNAGNAIGKEDHVDTIANNLNDGSFVEVVS